MLRGFTGYFKKLQLLYCLYRYLTSFDLFVSQNLHSIRLSRESHTYHVYLFTSLMLSQLMFGINTMFNTTFLVKNMSVFYQEMEDPIFGKTNLELDLSKFSNTRKTCRVKERPSMLRTWRLAYKYGISG